MPWQGDGTFVRTDATRQGVNVWDQARQASVKINSQDHDSHDEDLADGLENCLTRDGQNAPSGNLPMGGNRHTDVGDAVATSDYATLGQLLNYATPFVPPANVGGTANAITLAPSVAATAYEIGKGYRFFAEAANTGNVTVAVSGLSAQSVRRVDGAQIGAGELPLGRYVTIVYNGAGFLSDIHPPAAQAPGNTGLDQDAVDARIRALVVDPAEVGVGGTFDLSLIPILSAGFIGSGVLDLARIPGIDVSRIPDLPASQTTSGVFNIGRIPDIPYSKLSQDYSQETDTTWNVNTRPNAYYNISGDVTIGVSGASDGAYYAITIVQDSTGGHSVTWSSAFSFQALGVTGQSFSFYNEANSKSKFLFAYEGGTMHCIGLAENY